MSAARAAMIRLCVDRKVLTLRSCYHVRHRRTAKMAVRTEARASDITVELTDSPKQKPDPATLVFGTEFTDHMLVVEWSAEKGWQRPAIKPLQNLSLHPACSVFNYAIEVSSVPARVRGGPDDGVRGGPDYQGGGVGPADPRRVRGGPDNRCRVRGGPDDRCGEEA
ncbi:unnamed protein product [Ranitomeya imitator]|uniref:Uncharacterized protein n=1 Tax=Ranitomeya imitator TaxID=111125 RepID=A0ABN9M5I6_9NEOB|nr:unnamed protein product [Ranitomeya imitator]